MLLINILLQLIKQNKQKSLIKIKINPKMQKVDNPYTRKSTFFKYLLIGDLSPI